eukprot:3489721-Rhodomonas_salina.1
MAKYNRCNAGHRPKEFFTVVLERPVPIQQFVGGFVRVEIATTEGSESTFPCGPYLNAQID